jgi:hypothetical protein
MSEFIIVYWRDIPAQIIKGKGRKAEKNQLSERFEKAIDRCAMKIGAKDSESYLKDWHKRTLSKKETVSDSIQEQVRFLEKQYTDVRINEIIQNGGWEL